MKESLTRWMTSSPRRRAACATRATILIGTLIIVSGSVASAQLVVYDAATKTRNSITAALSQYLYELQREQHDKLRKMADRLSVLTDLRKYALEDVPRWRTHGGNLAFAQSFLNALISGDPDGAAYLSLTHALERPTRLDQLPSAARRSVVSRLATVDLADAAAIAATHYTGQLRLYGRKSELPAINALESDVINSASQQSTAAVLDKISGASLIGARQRQARIQLLTGVLEQLLVDSKRARDTDTAALDMQIVTWRDRRAADEAFVVGSGDALRTWRQP